MIMVQSLLLNDNFKMINGNCNVIYVYFKLLYVKCFGDVIFLYKNSKY